MKCTVPLAETRGFDYDGSETIIKKLFSPCLLDIQNASTIDALGSYQEGEV